MLSPSWKPSGEALLSVVPYGTESQAFSISYTLFRQSTITVSTPFSWTFWFRIVLPNVIVEEFARLLFHKLQKVAIFTRLCKGLVIIPIMDDLFASYLLGKICLNNISTLKTWCLFQGLVVYFQSQGSLLGYNPQPFVNFKLNNLFVNILYCCLCLGPFVLT